MNNMSIPSQNRFLKVLGYGIGALVLLFNLVLLWPELSLAALPLNDDVLHFTLSLSMADSLREGEFILDPWIPYGNSGFPVFHYYPPLPHLVSGLMILLLPLSPLVVFNGLKLLLLLLFPVALYLASRSLSLPVWSAWMAAACGASISAPGLYGLDYQSYLWSGFGLYGQLWGAVLLPLVLSGAYLCLNAGRHALRSALLLAALILSHAVYAWMALIFILVFLLAGPGVVRWRDRLIRLAGLLLPALALSAFFWLPHLLDRQFLNRSVWEPAWKYDSFGADFILRQLFTGALFDQGRLPLASLLAACGLGFALRRGSGAARCLAAAFITAVILTFGRPTWGILTSFWPLAADMHLHRLIGGIQLFGVLLAGYGFGALMDWSAGRWQKIATAAGLVLALAILGNAAIERYRYFESNREMMQRSIAETAAQGQAIDATLATLKQTNQAMPGRVYAGLGNNWGKDFTVGYMPWYARLSLARLDNLGYLYQAMPLVSDIQVLFNDQRFLHYDLFNVRYVLAPASLPLPQYLQREKAFGAWNLYAAPTTGAIGLVRSTVAFYGDRRDVFTLASGWLNSPYLPARNHPALFLGETAPQAAGDFRQQFKLSEHRTLPLLKADEASPPQGVVLSQHQERGAFTAEIAVEEPAVAMLKSSYHPNWTVRVDGVQAELLHLVPGFMGVRIGAGRHRVEFRYQPGWLKAGLLLAGLLVTAACFRLPRGLGVLGGSSKRGN